MTITYTQRKILAISIVVLCLLLALSAVVLYFVQFTNKDENIVIDNSTSTGTQQIVSYAVSYPTQSPVSFVSNSNNNIVEQTEIVPLNAATLTKNVNTYQYCEGEGVTPANLGLVRYWTSSGDFSTHNENQKSLLINNRLTVQGATEEQDFNEVVNLIENKTELTSYDKLHAFTSDCTGGAAHVYIKSFDVDFPAVDKSIAYIYVGGTQYAWRDLNDVKFTINILAQKGNNVMKFSEYFEGSELLTADQVAQCSTNSGYDYQYVPMECIRDTYLQTPSAQQIVNQKAQALIKFFEWE